MCAEEIQEQAVKCRHCGHMMNVVPSHPTTQVNENNQARNHFQEGIKKRRKTYLTMCLVLGGIFIIFAASGVGEDSLDVIAGLIAIPAAIFWWKCYKCPSCNKYLNIFKGNGFMKAPESCKKCGASTNS